MSRQPPLPPGLPPRPSGPPRADSRGGSSYRPQDDHYRGPSDTYRSQRDNYDNYRPRSPPPMYEFRGDYRQPASDDRRFPARYEDRAPGNSPARTYGAAHADVYRPREEAFTFRHDAPSSVDFRQADTYRTRSPPRQRAYPQDNGNSFRPTNGHQSQRGRGGYRGRGGPRLASEREFLKGNRAPTPELMPGMDEDEGNGVRYKPIEDVSDSDEAEMDLSDDENADAQQPKKKQARTDTKTADGDSAPRWSNPDPYTALPPPDESQRKKKDVVKLIRKARVNTNSENTTKTEAETDDFISFDFGTDAEDNEYEPALAVPNGSGVVGAPTGPRSAQPQRENMRSQEIPRQQHHESFNSAPSYQGPPVPDDKAVPQNRERKALRTKGPQGNAPGKPPIAIDLTEDSPLGSRKRNIRDEIKGPPIIHESLKGKKPESSGGIVRQWRQLAGSTGTPWIEIDHSDTVSMGFW
jgi:non-canonical poly(A) RNA polymerase PAPD5/7